MLHCLNKFQVLHKHAKLLHVYPIYCLNMHLRLHSQISCFKYHHLNFVIGKKEPFQLQHVTYLSTSRNLERGISQSLKEKIFGLISSTAKIRVGARIAYEKCTDALDYNELFNYFKLPDTFHSWFLTLQLHIWICAIAVISEKNGRMFRNELVHSMWVDVELRLSQLQEIRRSERKKYLSSLVDQFQAALIAYDEGLLSDDTVLAGVVWRTLYGFRPVDPRLLEAVILYIRKQVNHLDSLNLEDVMHQGSVTFLPLKSIILPDSPK